MHRSHAATAPLMDIRTGGCSAWQLPPDATCARIARSLVRDTMTALGLPGELTHTAITLVSELATNAFQHAPGSAPHATTTATTTPTAPNAHATAAGLPELWLYVRRHPAPQLVMTVFDTHRYWNRHPGPRAFLPESGRGLEIVTALSCAWGVHPSRPRRQGPCAVPGKAVWAAIRLPDSRRQPRERLADTRHPTPYEAITALHELLAARGITRVQRADNGLTSVLCLRPELTVWADACFRWRVGGSGGHLRRPFDDVVDVAEQLIHRYEEIDLPFPWTATATTATSPPPTETASTARTPGPAPNRGTNS